MSRGVHILQMMLAVLFITSTTAVGRGALCISTPHICARSESPLQDFRVLFQQYFTAALLTQTNRGFVFMTQPENRAQSSSSDLTPTLSSFSAHHLFCLSADLPSLFCPFDPRHFEFLSNGFLPAFYIRSCPVAIRPHYSIIQKL